MRSLGICTVLAALAVAPRLAADPCFCLQDAKDRIWYDCVTWSTSDPDPQYACYSSTDPSERKRVERGHLLKRIEAGKGHCDPCRPKAPDARGTMRPMGSDPGRRAGAAP